MHLVLFFFEFTVFIYFLAEIQIIWVYYAGVELTRQSSQNFGRIVILSIENEASMALIF